jgi:hypothetical protein
MQLDGHLIENLKAAVRSSRRLRGERVYEDALRSWSERHEIARSATQTGIESERP